MNMPYAEFVTHSCLNTPLNGCGAGTADTFSFRLCTSKLPTR
ncbi:hypothetical protein [Nonomuraea turkmeniaca]|nr:hypothetical protein [Nonomuraea turkmeniaca]